MVETVCAYGFGVPDRLDAIEAGNQGGDLGEARGILHIDMGDLVIGHCEGLRRAGIEDFAAMLLGAHGDQPGRAQGAVDMHSVGGGRDAVFRDHDDTLTGGVGMGDEVSAERIHLAQIALQAGMREVRPEPLQVVVEMRQVGEGQRGLARLHHVLCRLGDPVRRGDVGQRTPEPEERELAELGVQFVMEFRGIGVVVGDLAAIGGVHRARGRRVIRRSVHVVPPEHLGAGETGVAGFGSLPDLLAGDQLVWLAPEEHLAEIAEIPAVGDRAVARGHQPGDQRRLHRAGHRRGHGLQGSHRPARGQGGKVWRVRAHERGR